MRPGFHGWLPQRVLVVFMLGLVLRCGAYQVITNAAWDLRIGASSDSSPAVARDGTIHLGDWAGRFWAVNPNGTKKWSLDTGHEIKSSPAVATNGDVFFGGRDRHLWAVDADGRLRWKFRTGGWVDSSPAIAADGSVCFGSWDGNFYSLSSAGSNRWSFKTGGPVVSSPAIGTNGTLFFGSHDHRLYALTSDGVKLWDYKTGGPIISSPALDSEGNSFFTSVDGHLYSLDASGRLRWKLHTGSFTESSPVLGPGGVIYAGVNLYLWAVSAKGEKIWERLDEGMADATPMVLSDATVLFVTRYGMIKDVRADDGSDDTKLNWMFYLYGHGSSCPGIATDGTLYVSGRWFQFHALTNGVPLMKTAWPKFRGNARNTGNFADER